MNLLCDRSNSQDAVCQNTLVNEKHVICLLTDYQQLPGPPLMFPRPISNPLRQKQACFFEITFLMDFACLCFFLVQKLNYWMDFHTRPISQVVPPFWMT
jgi:hypothetical protein